MQIGERQFKLEVADTDAARARGLMRRDSIPADGGMLFVFPHEQIQRFWMKNTRIPLDLIFLDSDGRIVSIHALEPYDTTTTASVAPARYAIELNRGAASAAGVNVGDVLDLPPF